MNGLSHLDPPPRLPLTWGMTPLHRLDAMSRALGPSISVKRDDLTGSHLSGNKIRKLEFLLAEAKAAGATHVITCGGVQSNHCRATAMAAAPLGMSAIVVLRTDCGTAAGLPEPPTGNVLLSRLVGARVETVSPEGYRDRGAVMARLAAEVRAAGGIPYIVPEGGSNAVGAWGYMRCAHEILAQNDTPPDAVVVATGSGGTLAGLALGFEAFGAPTQVIGMAVCDDAPYFNAIVESIADEAAERWSLLRPSPGRYRVVDHYVGRGYGLSTDAELAFLRDTARRDGIVLDPVYSNKALRGLTLMLQDDPMALGERVVFIHTGGIFGLFPQASQLASVL